MKKISLALCFACFTYLMSYAQEDTRIGVFVGYGSEIESIGFGANAEFPIADKLTIAPSLMYFLPNDTEFIKTTIFEVNGNVNYYFADSDALSFYALGGINYTSVKVKVDDFGFGIGGGSASEGKIGLNLGAGANFNIDKNWMPFAELKYVLGDFDQLVLVAGVKFNI